MVPPLSWITSPRHIALNPPADRLTASNHEVEMMTRHLLPRIPQSAKATQTAISIAGLDTGTKIGIIVGITVIAILILIGGGLGILSYRSYRRKQKVRSREGSGDSTGSEMERKPTKESRKECKTIGLWDNLRIGVREDEGAERGEERGAPRVRRETENANVGQESR
jgi:hypothetical protein